MLGFGLGLGIDKDSVEDFSPADIPDILAWWDASDADTMTLETGTGIGDSTVSTIANKVDDSGTYDLTCSGADGIGSSFPSWIYGAGGKPCLSNIDAVDAWVYTDNDSVYDSGRTFFFTSRIFSNASATFIQGGTLTTGVFYINTSGVLRYSDIEGAGDIDIIAGVTPESGLLVYCVRINSDSSVDVFARDISNKVSFDPKDAGLNQKMCFLGRYNSGSGTGKQESHEAIVYDRALTDAEISQVMAYQTSKWADDENLTGIVLIGQSNSVGYFTLNGASTFDLQNTRFKVFNYADNLVDYDEDVAISDSTDTNYPIFTDSNADYSMGPALMNYLSRRLPGKIVCIPANDGGTQVTNNIEWGQRTTDFDTATLFGATNERIRLAQQAGINVSGFALQQGEAEANSAVAATGAEWDGATHDLINDFRGVESLNLASVPWSIGVISDDCPNPPHTQLNAIQTAQRAFTKTNVAVADTSDSTDFPTAADNVHYNSAGLDAAGALHAEKLYSLL